MMTQTIMRSQPEPAYQRTDEVSGSPPRISHRSKRTRHSPNIDKLCPQQRYAKLPKHPGVATFDSDLRRLPLQRGGRRQRVHPATKKSLEEQLAALVLSCSDAHGHQQTLSDEKLNTQTFPNHVDEAQLDDKAQTHKTQIGEYILNTNELTTTFEKYSSSVSSSSRDLSDGYGNLSSVSRFSNFDMDLCQLEMEAKLIYIDLANTQETRVGPTIVLKAIRTSEMPTWQALGGLRTALLRRDHDFFHISRDNNAPDSLRRLAVRYGSSARCSDMSAQNFEQFVQASPEQRREQIVAFAQSANSFLDRFEQADSVAFGSELRLISGYIHCYLRALFDAESLDLYGYRYSPESDSSIDTGSQSAQRRQSSLLDEQLREWYFSQCELPRLVPAEWVDELYEATELPLKDSVLYFLTGWLCFGPRIAVTFHDFCKVFKFLAWIGAVF